MANQDRCQTCGYDEENHRKEAHIYDPPPLGAAEMAQMIRSAPDFAAAEYAVRFYLSEAWRAGVEHGFADGRWDERSADPWLPDPDPTFDAEGNALPERRGMLGEMRDPYGKDFRG